MPLAADLLAILVCPVPECRAPLVERHERLSCTRCGLEYRIEHGWPVLIPDEAERPNATSANPQAAASPARAFVAAMPAHAPAVASALEWGPGGKDARHGA